MEKTWSNGARLEKDALSCRSSSSSSAVTASVIDGEEVVADVVMNSMGNLDMSMMETCCWRYQSICERRNDV